MPVTRTVMVCNRCGEEPRGEDPGLSAGVCAFCGYWGLPPGPAREKLRAERRAQAGPIGYCSTCQSNFDILQYQTCPSCRPVRPDVGAVDVVKCICECVHCKPGSKEPPIPIVIACPECKLQHVDRGEWATRPHKTHRCVDSITCDYGSCTEPVTHVERFDGRVRGWCSEHVPMSGHYEHCPEPCTMLLVELLKRGCGFEWQPSLIHTVGVERIE